MSELARGKNIERLKDEVQFTVTDSTLAIMRRVLRCPFGSKVISQEIAIMQAQALLERLPLVINDTAQVSLTGNEVDFIGSQIDARFFGASENGQKLNTQCKEASIDLNISYTNVSGVVCPGFGPRLKELRTRVGR